LYVVVCEPDAAVPLIVIGYVPAGVDDDVESVTVAEPPEVTLAGENDADAPAGSPLALNETDCAVPEVVAVETAALAPLPAVTAPDVGLTAIEKSFGGGVPLTVRLNDVVCEPDAAVPVIVIGYVPAGVEDDVENVTVEEPPEVTLAGENDADAPDGSPLALSETDCALPDVVAVETVALVPLPAVTVPEAGLTEIKKPFGGGAEPGPKAATPFGVPSPVGPS
jgi:hypothetical protein